MGGGSQAVTPPQTPVRLWPERLVRDRRDPRFPRMSRLGLKHSWGVPSILAGAGAQVNCPSRMCPWHMDSGLFPQGVLGSRAPPGGGGLAGGVPVFCRNWAIN